MVTAVTTAASQAAALSQPTPGDHATMLSDAARGALEGLGRMSDRFAASADAMQAQSAAALGPAGQTDTAAISKMMQLSTQMQVQVVEFAMATSMSSSLGNNLNTFLKGQ